MSVISTYPPLTTTDQEDLSMARLHLAQIAYLSQDLLEHLKNANTLVVRSKGELDLIHHTVKALMTVSEEFEKDMDDNTCL